jgi:small subunit ribosomal protein S9
MADQKVYYATGRRKTSSARIFLKPGKGQITINGKSADKYLSRKTSRMVIMQPLRLVSQDTNMDADVTVCGGGETGQAGAILHGLARALIIYNPEYRPALKKAGHLTRDARMVERKKYGKHKARRSTQFSKR